MKNLIWIATVLIIVITSCTKETVEPITEEQDRIEVSEPLSDTVCYQDNILPDSCIVYDLDTIQEITYYTYDSLDVVYKVIHRYYWYNDTCFTSHDNTIDMYGSINYWSNAQVYKY